MLRIRQSKHLASALGYSVDEMLCILRNPSDYYEELILTDPARSKQRIVVDVRGAMRAMQVRLYRKILLPRLKPSEFSHGSVTGRSIKTNAKPHLRSTHVFKADIANFFPSIHYTRVYNLFVKRFECSPDVARLCTKICTFHHHLALGLITSPILADQILRRPDRRIAGMCNEAGLVYTRYVDDVTISGNFNLEKTGFPKLLEDILLQDGLHINRDKFLFGRLAGEMAITGIRPHKGHLDVTKEYADELDRQLSDAMSLARDEVFNGPYYTPQQILGRVRFVCWVNPGRRHRLIRKYRSIHWKQVRANARARSLVVSKRTLSKLSADSSSTERL